MSHYRLRASRRNEVRPQGAALHSIIAIFWTALNSTAQLQPAAIFKTALEEIRSQSPIPILLPAKLPAPLREQDVKLITSRVSKDGYFISLYADEFTSNASYIAGFGGETVAAYRGARRGGIQQNGGRMAWFMPVSCGGSCALANLWWEQDGAVYQIQIKLGSDTKPERQEEILVEIANLMVANR